MKMQNIIIAMRSIGFLILLGMSCSNEKEQKESNIWADTSWHNLENENIKIRLPNRLKRSSRFRLSQDLPVLSKDTNQLRLVENSLAMLEFEDSEIDIYFDTTKDYRLIIICNTQKIEFNKKDASILKKLIETNNQKTEKLYPNLEFGKLYAKLNSNSNLLMARYTTSIINKTENSQVYNSIYYLTGNAYTLIVYEFSEDEELIEQYLWATKI